MQDKGQGIAIGAHKVLDLAMSVIAFLMAFYIKQHLLPQQYAGLLADSGYGVVVLLMVIIWYVSLSSYGSYGTYKRTDFATIFINLTKGLGLAMAGLISCLYILKMGETISRLLLGIFLVLDLYLLTLSKGILHNMARRQIERGTHSRKILVVGNNRTALDSVQRLIRDGAPDYRVIGWLGAEEDTPWSETQPDLRVAGHVDRFFEVVRSEAVDEVVFVFPLSNIRNPERYMQFAEDMGILVRFVPEWEKYQALYRPTIARTSFDDFSGVPTLAFSSTPADHKGLILKSAFDRVMSAVFLVALSPLFAIIALSIKLTSRGPVFFRQERVTLNGRKFLMYKFRTMVQDAEKLRASLEEQNEMDGPVFKIANDPRITPLGRFMRRTSLDELPQLINVLKGEMSFVGPRPPIPSEVEKYDPWQRRRLSMRPGLTCIWQVSGRNQIDFDNWMRLDLQYIDNWSWGLDLRLLLKTIPVVLFGRGDNVKARSDEKSPPDRSRRPPRPGELREDRDGVVEWARRQAV